MPSDDTVRRVAVRIKLDADRLQLFDLLLERVERLLWKYGIHSSINLKPLRPSFAGLPGFLYAAPAVLESVYRGDMMTGEIVIAFDEQHLCGFCERPGLSGWPSGERACKWGHAIAGAL